jgi:hypothetical protein
MIDENSTYHYLGGDQQSRSAPFIDMIAPNDFDKLVSDIWKNVSLQYTWIYILFSGYSVDKCSNMLAAYLAESRTSKTVLTPQSFLDFKQILMSKYGFSDEHTNLFLNGFINADEQGLVPASLKTPWTYTSTSAIEDIANQLANKTTNDLTNRIFWYALGGIAVYGIATSIIPQLAAGSKTIFSRK